mmetsp:Transcript_11045/g.22838  ORF Transcript_11045/g.22838 Transcript_11045/m.22838 type:complete len:224 (-) Transcript_11045:159-830(-)
MPHLEDHETCRGCSEELWSQGQTVLGQLLQYGPQLTEHKLLVGIAKLHRSLDDGLSHSHELIQMPCRRQAPRACCSAQQTGGVQVGRCKDDAADVLVAAHRPRRTNGGPRAGREPRHRKGKRLLAARKVPEGVAVPSIGPGVPEQRRKVSAALRERLQRRLAHAVTVHDRHALALGPPRGRGDVQRRAAAPQARGFLLEDLASAVRPEAGRPSLYEEAAVAQL